MEKTPAEMMKEYVNSQQFESTADVMAAMKELFADVVQRVMECELDNMLGYEKSQRMGEADENEVSKNYRNGYSKKRVKTQLGEVDIRVPRDRNGEYDPQIIGKYDRQRRMGWKKKLSGWMHGGVSQRDIAEQVKALYDVDISPELVSKISEKSCRR